MTEAARETTGTRSLPHRPRVFCIGWHKTGTSTIGYALHYLGYRVMGARLDTAEDLQNGRIESVLSLTEPFDALQDVPWAALFRELDIRYPGSKFVLTTRAESDWLRSAATHFKDTFVPLHEWLYGEGILHGNESVYLDRFRRHNNEVRAYFGDRPENLLEMNLAAGDDWQKLCTFLECDVPDRGFPHANQNRSKRTPHQRFMANVKDSLPSPLRKGLSELKQIALRPFGFEDKRNIFHNTRENRQARMSKRDRGDDD